MGSVQLRTIKERKLRRVKPAVKKKEETTDIRCLHICFSDFPEWVWTGEEPVVKQREGQKKWVEVSGVK